jgi:hypothetical protein
MSVKSMKAVLAVAVIALMLGSTSLLLVAADEHGAGAMIRLEPGAQHWYTLAYPGSGTVDVSMDVDPAGGAGFLIVTSDAVRAWEAGADLDVTGRGSNNPYEDADLFWSGSFGQSGDFYLVVEYTGDGSAPSLYTLDVSGAEVSSDIDAEGELTRDVDGLWCYKPVFEGIKPITFDPYEGDPGKGFLQVPYLSEWTGFLSGSSTDYGLIIEHVLDPGPPAVAAPMLFIATNTFEDAEVGGVSGGLEMDTMGDADPAGGWRGTWVITSGTGDLEGLKARGTFWGPGWLPPDGGSDECPEGMGVVYYSVDD